MTGVYYETNGITIHHGDCREVLPTLDGDVALLLADPPYGDTSLDWDVRDLEWLRLSTPLLRPTASMWCFGSLRMFMAQGPAFAAQDWRVVQDVVWQKHNGSGFHADRFKRVHEHVVQFIRDNVAWSSVYKQPVTTLDATARQVRRKRRPAHTGDIGASSFVAHDGGPRLMTSVIEVRSCHGYAEHPTQKPTGIIEPLLRYSTASGDLVLDPTMGSGSTLVACKAMGRRAIGIELDERQCEVAARRLSQELPGMALR